MTIYKQLTLQDRVLMSHLRWQGHSYAQIATQMGRHRSTLYREFSRNSCFHIDGQAKPSDALVLGVVGHAAIAITPIRTSKLSAYISERNGAPSKSQDT